MLYCTDPYSSYKGKRERKSRQSFARFLRLIQGFCLLFLGCTEQSVRLIVGTNFDVQGGPYNNTDLAQITRQIFGTVLVCYKWTFLAGNCDFAADMYFPEAE
jgi:hypothetical protein